MPVVKLDNGIIGIDYSLYGCGCQNKGMTIMAKEALGIGSVIQVTRNKKLKDGTSKEYKYWVVHRFPICSYIKDGKNFTEFFKSPYFKTKNEAMELRNELVMQRSRLVTERFNVPIVDVISQCLYHKFVVHDITSKTYGSPKKCGYLYVLEKYIKPALGDMIFNDFTKSMFAEKLVGMPRETGKIALTIMRQTFEFAIDNGFVDKNPIANMKMPKDKDELGRIEEKEEVVFITPEQAWKIIEMGMNRQRNIGIGIKLGFLTGLRSSELLGITYDKIDFSNHTIKIYESYGDLGDGKEDMKGVKNRSSIRTIVYPAGLHDELLWCQMNSTSKNWLMENSKGTRPITQHNLYNRYFRTPGISIGLHKVNTRIMRHFYVTYMLELGIDKHHLKDETGHTSFRMIDTVYRNKTTTSNDKIQEVSSELLEKIKPVQVNKSNIIQFPGVV